MKYDYLIVGSGLFGATFAYLANKSGKKVKVIEKREHFGGNIYCEKIENINVHKYGAHIFHTDNKQIWDFVNSFVPFNRYTNSPVAISKDKLYNLPFNMNTFTRLWGIKTPDEAKKIIAEQAKEIIETPKNLEEQAVKLVGRDIFETLIKEYTEKQWGRSCSDLPAFIIKRLPVRFTFDNNYFYDKYQGIPEGGYNKLIEGLLKDIKIELNIDFLKNKEQYENIAKKIIYTGEIDKFFNFKFGELEYRSVSFATEILETDNFQGNAVVNYIDKKYPWTRIIEHKHFEFGTQEKTVISKEFSKEFSKGDEPYYPVNDERNSKIYSKYKELAALQNKYIFGGRLAEYKYYDMHQVIKRALDVWEEE